MMSGEVDDIVSKLIEKHGEKYTPVQLNGWAHMINTHKYESLDSPPKKSFFWGGRKDLLMLLVFLQGRESLFALDVLTS